MDYDIQLNDVIQLTVRTSKQDKPKKDAIEDEKLQNDKKNRTTNVEAESQYYKIGDLIDVRLAENNGAWYEGTINKILRQERDHQPEISEEGDLVFTITR